MTLEFDDIIDELWGNGWFQKRLIFFLLGVIFLFTPWAFLNQVFVLHKPGKNILVQGDPFSQTLAFVDFDFWRSAVLPRCCASSATFTAAQAELGAQRK